MKFKSIIRYAVVAAIATTPLFYSSCNNDKASEKPKYLWMAGDANFDRFASKDSITYYLEKARETGFNNIVVDVKPTEGHVIYKSKIRPEYTIADSIVIERDWDYLQYVIDESHRLGMKVTATACIFPAGETRTRRGVVYEDSCFDGKTCIEYLGNDSLGDIRDNKAKVAAFLNPVRKDSRDYAMEMIKEIVTDYDVDGIALDYCRFPDIQSDFSPESKAAFEEYIGESVGNFPADIFTYDENGEIVPGKYYNQWLAFRAGVISDFIHEIHDTVKSIKPDVDINYWAASWIHAIEKNGQNWASPNSDWCMKYPYGSEAYKKTGFAPYLDNFIVGAYLERVYGPDDNESVEYAMNRADSVIMGDCHVIGSIQSLNHSADPADPHNLVNAVRCCLEKSEGLMVFDIVHIINRNQWAQIKEAIDSYESSEKE